MKESIRKLLYTVLTSQTLSSNGKFLFVSSTLNDIATYNVEKIASCIENISVEEISNPISVFNCPEKPVYSLAFHREFLIIGAAGNISGYAITATGAVHKKVWTIQVPVNPEHQEMNEINDMWVDKENDILFAGAGDGNLYSFSLEDGSFIKKYTGHEDYIHSVDGCDRQIVTGSEDGAVKFWDQREKDCAFTIEPYKNANIHRQKFGRWVGAVKLSPEWLATGGASRLTLFHLRNRQPFHIFNYPKEIHVADFVDGNLLAAGDSNQLITYSFKGNVISEIQTSGSAVYSVAWQKTSKCKILTACGSSNKIDVTTNFNYKDTQLSFYSKEKNI